MQDGEGVLYIIHRVSGSPTSTASSQNHRHLHAFPHIPPKYMCLLLFIIGALSVGREDRKLGIGLLPAPASSKFWRKWELSHFGGNRKHKKRWRWWILVVYAPETQRVMQFRKLTKCWLCTLCKHDNAHIIYKTSQELRILSSVTLNCQVTKIVMKSGSQLSEI